MTQPTAKTTPDASCARLTRPASTNRPPRPTRYVVFAPDSTGDDVILAIVDDLATAQRLVDRLAPLWDVRADYMSVAQWVALDVLAAARQRHDAALRAYNAALRADDASRPANDASGAIDSPTHLEVYGE